MNKKRYSRLFTLNGKCSIVILMMSVMLLSGLAGSASARDDVAIDGYDTVAYFTEGKAVWGEQSISYDWDGATWYFLSEEHRKLFISNPNKFAPQYDGWCAWAMTENRKAKTNPEVWKIVGGKLYLNCSKAAYQKWAQDIPGNIKKADANWKEMSESE